MLAHLGRAGDRPCILGAIAQATGLNPGTCARILGTLMSEGYVEQEGRRKGYRLGPMAYVLTAHGPYRQDLVACADPFIRPLAESTGETALVAILQQNTRYTICRAEGNHDIQVCADAVLRGDVYTTATGRLLLAHMPAAECDAFIRDNGLPTAATWPEAHTKPALLAALVALRAQDTVIAVTAAQLVGLARPIRQADRVVAALGLYLPASRFADPHKKTILKAMRTTADAISRRVTEMHSPASVPR